MPLINTDAGLFRVSTLLNLVLSKHRFINADWRSKRRRCDVTTRNALGQRVHTQSSSNSQALRTSGNLPVILIYHIIYFLVISEYISIISLN